MSDKATQSYVKGQIYTVLLASLNSDPDQPRKYIDPQALSELTASIQQYGVLEPVLFRQDGNGALYVVAGERRCLAAQAAGLTEIPAIFIDGSHGEIALVENLLRQDLTCVEESEAMDRIMKEQSYTQEDLSNILGKGLSTISETLSLTRLPQEIRDECRNDPSVPKRVLVEIARCKMESIMLSQYQKYRSKNLSAAELKDGRAKEKQTEAQILFASLQKMASRINKLNLARWREPDRQRLLSTTYALMTTAQKKVKEAATPSQNETS
jgi:ParB family transcriptional regulator, chromosome partitioning protein